MKYQLSVFFSSRERDRRAMYAWGEHPYVDVVDNRAGFETKVSIAKIKSRIFQN